MAKGAQSQSWYEEDDEKRGSVGRGSGGVGGGGIGRAGSGGRAIFHLSVKSVSRGKGRSATAAAAYRSGEKIECEREDKVHDYTAKEGVEATGLVFPDGVTWIKDRSQLWNAAEAAEVKRNAQVAREYEVAIPHQLSPEARQELVAGFAGWLANEYKVAADWAIHAPNRDGDQRNWHAHILTTTRVVGPEGFGAKTRILDVRQTSRVEVVAIRETWAVMANQALRQEGHDARIDHRSLQEIADEYAERRQAALEKGNIERAESYGLKQMEHERRPQRHVGVHATGMDRRVSFAAPEMSDNGLERQEIEEAARRNEDRVQARAERLRGRGINVWASWEDEELKKKAAKEKASQENLAQEKARQQAEQRRLDGSVVSEDHKEPLNQEPEHQRPHSQAQKGHGPETQKPEVKHQEQKQSQRSRGQGMGR